MIAEGAKVYRDTEQKVPYLVKDDQWIGYDDVDSYTEKVMRQMCWSDKHDIGTVVVLNVW
jgi:hypothetical protein